MADPTIEIEAKLLKAAVKDVVGVIEGRNTVPVLANVLIDASPGGMALQGTDLDIWLHRHVDVVSAKKLRTTVCGKVLAAVANKLPGDSIATLVLKDRRLEVTAGRARFSLETVAAEDFPEQREPEWTSRFELPEVELRMMIDRLRFAVSTEETRYYLNGILFHRVEAEGAPALLRCAATDGHRLARWTLPLPDGAETLNDAIVPRKAVALLRAIADKAEGAIEMAFAADRVRFDFGHVSISAKLIDGTYPDYSRVIPTANDKRLAIPADAMAEALGRIQVVSTEKTRAVELSLGKDLATLTVRSADFGHGVEEIPCDYGAEPMKIGFNSRYLLDVLGSLRGADLEIDLQDAAAPTLVRDPKNDRALYVLMPMRV